jgi:DNA repair photolyase
MENKVSVKINSLEILEKQLKNHARKEQYGIIVLSSATDPYLQLEKEYQLTRKMLELILYYKFPVHILTKSDLVVRDFELLKKIGETAILPADLQGVLKHKVFITFSFSTIDNSVGKIFEPGATLPSKRLAVLQQTLAEGFCSGVSLMPLLPYITDTDEYLNVMFKTFKDLGVNYIFPASITLFGSDKADSKPLMLKAIKTHYPHLSEKYQKLFAYGFQPPSWYREAFYQRITTLREQYNLNTTLQ